MSAAYLQIQVNRYLGTAPPLPARSRSYAASAPVLFIAQDRVTCPASNVYIFICKMSCSLTKRTCFSLTYFKYLLITFKLLELDLFTNKIYYIIENSSKNNCILLVSCLVYSGLYFNILIYYTYVHRSRATFTYIMYVLVNSVSIRRLYC